MKLCQSALLPAQIVLMHVCAFSLNAQEGLALRRGYASSALASQEVELRFARWGDAILVEDVMINGRGPFRFLLDTGAEGAGRVDSSLVEALKLPAIGAGASIGVLGQQLEMARYRIDTLAISGLSFSSIEMMGRNYNSEIKGPGLRPIHGILGFHLFSEYLLKIDYPARTISITRGELPAPDGRHVLAMVSDDEDPEIEVWLGGQKATALLDTGAMGELGVPASIAEELRFRGEPVERGKENGVPLRSATLDGALQLGVAEFDGPTMMIAGRLNQVIIGARILAALRITYDQKNARVRIERPAPRRGFGVSFGWRDGGPWQFRGVEAGGIADAAGIRSTDELLFVNGRPLGEIDREDMLKFLDAETVVIGIQRDDEQKEIPLKRSDAKPGP